MDSFTNDSLDTSSFGPVASKYELDIRFHLVKQLGKGGFGCVYEAFDHKLQQQIAIKIIEKSARLSIEHLMQEADILHQMKHKNIVEFKFFIEKPQFFCIGMELLQGGSLQSFISKVAYSQEQARLIFKALIEGVHELHQRNIVHRDLKPANLLFALKNKPETLKIADFGLSTSNLHINFKRCHTNCGTRWFMAPEILKNEDYGKSVDIWACGVIFYLLLTRGQRPQYKEFSQQEFMEGTLSHIDWIIPSEFSPLERNLFQNMMKLEPVKRYTTREILNHPWVTGHVKAPLPVTAFQALENLERQNLLRMYFRAGYFLAIVKQGSERRILHFERQPTVELEKRPERPKRLSLMKKEVSKEKKKKNSKREEPMKNLLELHSLKDKLASAIELDRTLSKTKQKQRKFTPSPNEPEASKDESSFIQRSSAFYRRNQLLLKRAEQLEDIRVKSKMKTPKMLNIPGPNLTSGLQNQRRFTVHVKVKDQESKKQHSNFLSRQSSQQDFLVKSSTPQPEVFRQYHSPPSRNKSSSKLIKVQERKSSLHQGHNHNSGDLDFYSKLNRPVSAQKIGLKTDKSRGQDSHDNSAYGFQLTPSNRVNQSQFRSNYPKIPLTPQIRSQKELPRMSLVSKRDKFLDILANGEKEVNLLRRGSTRAVLPTGSYRRKDNTSKPVSPNQTHKARSYRGLQMCVIGSKDELSQDMWAKPWKKEMSPAGPPSAQKGFDYFKRRIN